MSAPICVCHVTLLPCSVKCLSLTLQFFFDLEKCHIFDISKIVRF